MRSSFSGLLKSGSVLSEGATAGESDLAGRLLPEKMSTVPSEEPVGRDSG